jgi:hypothetical protein
VILGPTFDQGNDDDSKATQDDRAMPDFSFRSIATFLSAIGEERTKPDFGPRWFVC